MPATVFRRKKVTNTVIVAGVDIGSRTSKAVLMEESEIISSVVFDTIMSPEVASQTIDWVLMEKGLSRKNLAYIVATGYGRFSAPYADEIISEISCHARGIHWYFPSVRTILDIGGQDSKAINCDGGRITMFVMNDKCAGGTGRFLEVMADLFQISLDDMARLSLQAKQEIKFSTTCVVYAKSEALQMLKRGVDRSDILAGLHDAVATMGFNLMRRIPLKKDFAMTGGVAKNMAVIKKIEEKVGAQLLQPPDPQIIGALGAALFARQRKQKTSPASA